MAATGKPANSAKDDAKRKGDAGEVLEFVFEQYRNDARLLDPDTNRTLHLAEIHAAPKDQWGLITDLHLNNAWSVKDTKAAVDRIRSVADLVPAWLPDVSSVYPKSVVSARFSA